MLAALASQRAQHESQLEAKLAERDAEALEALRLLDARHRATAAAIANRIGGGSRTLSGASGAASTSEVGEDAGARENGNGGGDVGVGGGGGVDSGGGDGGRDGGRGSGVGSRHRQRRRRSPMPSASASGLQNGARQERGGDEARREGAALSRQSAPQGNSTVEVDGRRLRSRSRARRALEPAEEGGAREGAGVATRTFRSASIAASAGATASAAAAAAVTARDNALREAKEESERLGEVISSPGGSDQSWPSPVPAMTGLAIGGGGGAAGLDYGSPYRRYDGNGSSGSPDSTTSGRLALSVACEPLLETTPARRAPVWTVGSGTAMAPAASDRASTSSTPAQTRASSGSPMGGVREGDWRVAVRSDAGASAGLGSTAGGGGVVGSSGAGLTVTEERYRGELEVLRSRVREVEGMMETRMEDRARVYRRKLRAAVTECRTLRVSGGISA